VGGIPPSPRSDLFSLSELRRHYFSLKAIFPSFIPKAFAH
jgi:hypothetical protein